jgi:AraC family transcriptional regulator, transcriptional activator FtrA
VNIMPKPRRQPDGPANSTVAVLAYDGLCTFEFGIAVEAFGLPRPELGELYRCVVCGIEPGPFRALGGIQVSAEAGLEAVATAGTIVVPGWRDPREVPPAPLIDALRAAAARGARLMSLCSGIFVLAATGLLDGRRATTHWRYFELLAAMYPEIEIVPDVLYVDGGDILTAAGSAAGLDLCLHVIRRDHGPRIANAVARRLVLPAHREGDQAQIVERPLPAEGARLAKVLDWARAHLDRDLTVTLLAERAGMSSRNFIRRVRDATGLPPARWLLEVRLARARDLLAATDMRIEQVATDCGFGSADTLRHHFRNRLKASPSRYRTNAA